MKKFRLEVTLDDDGQLTMNGHNDGFGAHEIVGFLDIKKWDIIDQINHPDRFKHIKHERTAVEDGEEISIEEKENEST